MTTSNIVLTPHRRGTEFRYASALLSPWVNTMFDGGILFTLRKQIAPSTIIDDAQAVAQVSVADGGIVFSSSTDFEVLIPGAATNLWPLQVLYWDMQGIVTATPNNRVLDIADGNVRIIGDVTRSQQTT